MPKYQAIAQAYSITAGLISLYLREGNPTPEQAGYTADDCLLIAEYLEELRATCDNFFEKLTKK
jgi:hypothetical protein